MTQLYSKEPLDAIEDYHDNQSPSLGCLTNEHLWLGKNDVGWHIPIMMTLRESAVQGLRQRSEEGHSGRQKKNELHKKKVQDAFDERE